MKSVLQKSEELINEVLKQDIEEMVTHLHELPVIIIGEEIIYPELSKEFNISGVYILKIKHIKTKQEIILYVGKSKNIKRRFASHRPKVTIAHKRYNLEEYNLVVEAIETSHILSLSLEPIIIGRLQPILNRAYLEELDEHLLNNM